MSGSTQMLSTKDIDPKISKEAEQAILLLVRAWPHLELALSEWLMALARLDADIGRIVIGNMDNNTKIYRLTLLADHSKSKDTPKILRLISKTHQSAVDIRNKVIHTPLRGALKKQPHTLLFGGKRHLQRKHDALRVEPVTLEQIRNAARFALLVHDEIQNHLGKAQPSDS